MKSKDLQDELLLSQTQKMIDAFDNLVKHRSPPTQELSLIEAHIQAKLEVKYVLEAGRIARQVAYIQYKKNKLLHDNAVHVLSTELLDIVPRGESPDIA
tara:strand:- start:4392 stop:4688 length:297 start_codon:yes stop_codon:yes gene_type:complete